MSDSTDNSRFRQFVDLIHTDDALEDVDYVVHRIHSKETSDHPRYAWIWRGGQIERNKEGSASVLVGNCFVKCPFVDKAIAEIHIWGEDFKEAELMRNNMLGALDRRQGARFELGPYSWWNEQEPTAEWDVSGVKCIMTVTVEILIGTEQAPATQIVAAEIEATFQDNPAGSAVEIVHTTTLP